MESVKRACLSVICGIKDCFMGMSSLINVLGAQEPESERESVRQRILARHTSPRGTVKDKLFQCFIFGLSFWVSNLIFNHIFLHYIFILLVEWTGEDLDSEGVARVRRFLYIVFCITWIFPIFAISKLLNFIWYQEIANMILAKSGLRRNNDIRLSDVFADLVKSLILQMFYCFQGYAVYFLPLPLLVQNIWYLFHLTLLTSLYAFEYKWVHMGLPLHRRLLNIDRKWPYYVGFGLTLALITTLFESFIDSMIIFATLFPLYVISSTVTSDIKSPIFSHPFHTFRVADSLSDLFIAFVLKVFPVGVSFFMR